MMTSKSGVPLYGDWRRRRLTKTNVHLYPERFPASRVFRPDADLPLCRKRIPRDETVIVKKGQPCTDCLVAALGGARL